MYNYAAKVTDIYIRRGIRTEGISDEERKYESMTGWSQAKRKTEDRERLKLTSKKESKK
jgi:hypothetical protein